MHTDVYIRQAQSVRLLVRVAVDTDSTDLVASLSRLNVYDLRIVLMAIARRREQSVINLYYRIILVHELINTPFIFRNNHMSHVEYNAII